MTLYEEAKLFYARKGQSLDDDIMAHVRAGCVIVLPHCIVLAHYRALDDCWHITFAHGVGHMACFFAFAPFCSRYVSFNRHGGRPRLYTWAALKKRIKYEDKA